MDVTVRAINCFQFFEAGVSSLGNGLLLSFLVCFFSFFLFCVLVLFNVVFFFLKV